MTVPTLEVTFNASGAAEAGSRGRAVVIVDVVDSSTSAEAALAGGAVEILGAAPAGVTVPVTVDPGAVGRRAASVAARTGTDVVVVSEPRVATDEERRSRTLPVLQALRTAGVGYELAPNQGAELLRAANVEGRLVVVVSTTGGAAFDAALAAGASWMGFATTARVEGRSGWEVTVDGARRAIDAARYHRAGISIVAASANSTDDVLAASEVARAVVSEGFLRLPGSPPA
ncbi:MAG TPA: hypothetical protein VJ868_06935 [Actinomycetota bacterium]|nr:hypothetical protein [Actinomycetota bacterium]